MSDTPRTDAEECEAFIGIHSYFEAEDVYRGYGFARQLERELTAAQAEALKLQERIETLENEKMELQKQLQQFGDNAFENALSLVNQRNQLQEENARLQERIGRLEKALHVYLQAGHKQARREASVIAKAALAKGTQ